MIYQIGQKETVTPVHHNMIILSYCCYKQTYQTSHYSGNFIKEPRYPIVFKTCEGQLKEEKNGVPTKRTNHLRKLTTSNFSLIISINLHNLPLQQEKKIFNKPSIFQHPTCSNNHSCYSFQTISCVSTQPAYY